MTKVAADHLAPNGRCPDCGYAYAGKKSKPCGYMRNTSGDNLVEDLMHAYEQEPDRVEEQYTVIDTEPED